MIGRLRGPIAAFQTSQVNLHPALLLPIPFSHLTSIQWAPLALTTSRIRFKSLSMHQDSSSKMAHSLLTGVESQIRKVCNQSRLDTDALPSTTMIYWYCLSRILENHTSCCYGICCSRCSWILCQGKGMVTIWMAEDTQPELTSWFIFLLTTSWWDLLKTTLYNDSHFLFVSFIPLTNTS